MARNKSQSKFLPIPLYENHNRPLFVLLFWLGAVASWILMEVLVGNKKYDASQAYKVVAIISAVIVYWAVLWIVFSRSKKVEKRAK